MTEKVFWKSALKASVLMYFIIGIFSMLVLVIFFNNELAQSINFDGFIDFTNMKINGPDYGIILVVTVLIVQVLLWIVFAFLHKRIPFNNSIAKVFLFNLVVETFFVVSSLNIKTPSIISKITLYQINPVLTSIIMFFITTIMFSYLFDFFKKEEKEEIKNKQKNKPASIPRRILAFSIDFAILIGIQQISVPLLWDPYIRYIWFEAQDWSFSQTVLVAAISAGLLSLFIQFLYWTITEGKFGASIGKKIFNIKVIKENGDRIGYREAFFRNSTKFFFTLRAFGFLDFFFMFTNKNKQRFFDKVAGTIVIRTDLKKEKEVEK